MKILIAGATGFIGKALVRALQEEKHEIIVLGRSIPKIQFSFGDTVKAWDFKELEVTKETIDVAINLAGESLVGFWNKSKKQKILNSRLAVTKRVIAFCVRQTALKIPIRLMQASAIGIYGIKGDHTYNENTPLPVSHDFLSQVGRAWERAAEEAFTQNIPTVIMRFGVVLDPNGGMLEYMFPAFKMGFGVLLGNGMQKISWITRSDLIKAILFLLARPELTGIINFVAKEPVSQRQFAELFANYLGRPLWLKLPRFLIHLCLGEMGDTLLFGSQLVEPYRLNEAGFEFDYPNLSYYFARRKHS